MAVKIHYRNAEYGDLITQHGLDDAETVFSWTAGEVIQAKGYGSVVRAHLPGIGAVYIKHYRRRKRYWKTYLRPSIAHREWANSVRMQKAGIPQPEVVCAGTATGSRRKTWDSYLITREVEGASSLETVLERLGGQPDGDTVARLAQAVVNTARKMRENGFCHWDFKPRNILVVTRQDVPTLYVIDSRSGRTIRFWNRRHCVERDYRFVLKHPLLGPEVAKLLDSEA
ncbi:MAG: hypothetical protein J7M19_00960 [Planctomycetes bacterium]|nr:hypothetical protein [Planctomycetota bacterium]